MCSERLCIFVLWQQQSRSSPTRSAITISSNVVVYRIGIDDFRADLTRRWLLFVALAKKSSSAPNNLLHTVALSNTRAQASRHAHLVRSALG
ncbi:hypothetical protein BCV70DRAFT_11063 [Testicularia cyperi]|uniref:Uncharacterized protein n=1 Tax=Testicularia cyperi TaxID=1882483 RepID=A0A317XXN5_9BASI|nr:hypothetical protein BCV70DRAFT_11063 [Testicularia cyperi]